MQIQFTTGTIALDLIEKLAIPRLRAEGAFVTVDMEGIPADQIGAEVGKLLDALTSAANSEDSDMNAHVLRATASALSNSWSAAVSQPLAEAHAADANEANQLALEAAALSIAPDTGSHSLPTGDASISNASQANSDTNATANEEIVNEQQEEAEQPRKRRG